MSLELELFKVRSRGTDLQILTGWSDCHLGPERAPGDNPTSRWDVQICYTGLDLKQPKLYTLPGRGAARRKICVTSWSDKILKDPYYMECIMKIRPFPHIFHTLWYPQYTQKSEHLKENTLSTHFMKRIDLTPPFLCVHTPTQLWRFISPFPHANLDKLVIPLFSKATPSPGYTLLKNPTSKMNGASVIHVHVVD